MLSAALKPCQLMGKLQCLSHKENGCQRCSQTLILMMNMEAVLMPKSIASFYSRTSHLESKNSHHGDIKTQVNTSAPLMKPVCWRGLSLFTLIFRKRSSGNYLTLKYRYAHQINVNQWGTKGGPCWSYLCWADSRRKKNPREIVMSSQWNLTALKRKAIYLF